MTHTTRQDARSMHAEPRSLTERLAQFPVRIVAAAHHRIAIREAGAPNAALAGPAAIAAPMALVLLHGIGSGSSSWLYQFEQLGQQVHTIAWDAPGYGDSALLDRDRPDAPAFAAALAALVDTLGLSRFVLVAQSLGAIIATAYAVQHPERVAALRLLSPAGGYGRADATERDTKLRARLESFDALGAAGFARERAANLLSRDASSEALELVRHAMSSLRGDGHTHAAHLLAQSDLATDARRYRAPVLIASGSADRITPETGCRAVAGAFIQGSYQSLGAIGHASYVESPAVVNALIEAAIQSC